MGAFFTAPRLCLRSFFKYILSCATPKMCIRDSFGTFAFAGACIGIGQVATALGLGVLLAQLAMPILAPLGKTGLTFGVLILGSVANLLLTPAAMCSLLSPALASIYNALGLSLIHIYTIYIF